MPTFDLPASKRIGPIRRLLKKRYPAATTALEWRDPLELLVATILSAQCTDERVNRLTKRLFAKYRSAADWAAADPAELELELRPTGFFRSKARAIRASAAKLVQDWGGEVPQGMEDLTALPGVARKTANVILGTCFRIASGIVVDTHVKRISARLGLTVYSDPEKIERDLMELVPKREWIDFGQRMLWHGRLTCQARAPRCSDCILAAHCPYPHSEAKPPGKARPRSAPRPREAG